MNTLMQRRKYDADRTAAIAESYEAALADLERRYRSATSAEKLLLMGRIKRFRDETKMVRDDANRAAECWASLQLFARMVEFYPPPSRLGRSIGEVRDQIPQWFKTLQQTAIKPIRARLGV